MTSSPPSNVDTDADIAFGEWFRCPRCGEDTDGAFTAKLFLALQNASFDLSCRECRFSHTERDPYSRNLRWALRLKLYFTPQRHTHPRCSRKAHAATVCPYCTSRSVLVELELMTTTPRPGEKAYETRFSARCATCGGDYETRLSHK